MFRVPLSREENTGKFVELFFAIVPSLWQRPQSEPILFINGGPGFAWSNPDPQFLTDYMSLRVDRYLILMDQRGTWRGEPWLSCGDSDRKHRGVVFSERQRRCLADWRERGFDPKYFGTREAAEDVRELRQELGLSRWNILAFSYGGALAQRLIQIDGAAIRSVVLDSPLPLEPYGLTAQHMRNRANLIRRVAIDCALETRCRDAYGDLLASFTKALAILEAAPVPFDRGRDVEPYTGRAFVLQLMALFDRPGGVRHVPYHIDRISKHLTGERKLSPFNFYWRAKRMPEDEFGSGRGPGADAAYFGVMCQEHWSAEIRATWTSSAPHDLAPVGYFTEYWAEELETICSSIPARPLTVEFSSAEMPPALILSGAYDRSTTPEGIDRVARLLPKAQLLRFGYLGHGATDHSACALYIVAAFIQQPDLAIDRGCQRFHDRPRFWLPHQYGKED